MSVRDENGLIVPRKLPNPCLISAPVRDLHREIKWNARTGVNVLNNKTELEKALERHRRLKTEKEKKEEEEEAIMMNPFQKMLAERAKRLEQIEKGNKEDDEPKEEGDRQPVIRSNSDLKTMFEQTLIVTHPTTTSPTVGLTASQPQRKPTKSPLTASVTEPLPESEPRRSPCLSPSISSGLRTGCLAPKFSGSATASCLGPKSKSSWELSSSSKQPTAGGNSWEGNSSGSSSKSSSPEPESEFLKVFAQLKGGRMLPA